MPKGPNPYADMEPTDDAPFGWTIGDNGQPRPRKRAPFNRSAGQVRRADPDDPQDSGEDPDELAADPEAKHLIADSGDKKAQRTVHVTASVKRDIRAKLALLLGMPAMMAKRRDPYCGGALVEAVPEISDALVDLIADSPDLVAFFTSSAGYMKWLRLATALQPVAEVAWQHHVSHKIGEEDNKQGGGPAGYMQPSETRYHAPAFA